jgi:fructose-1,6-bisphosphatase
VDTIVSEEDTILIFSMEYAVSIFDPEDGSSKFFRNVCIHPKGLYDAVTQKDAIEMMAGCANNAEN